jgi:hypothetical protein
MKTRVIQDEPKPPEVVPAPEAGEDAGAVPIEPESIEQTTEGVEP